MGPAGWPLATIRANHGALPAPCRRAGREPGWSLAGGQRLGCAPRFRPREITVRTHSRRIRAGAIRTPSGWPAAVRRHQGDGDHLARRGLIGAAGLAGRPPNSWIVCFLPRASTAEVRRIGRPKVVALLSESPRYDDLAAASAPPGDLPLPAGAGTRRAFGRYRPGTPGGGQRRCQSRRRDSPALAVATRDGDGTRRRWRPKWQTSYGNLQQPAEPLTINAPSQPAISLPFRR